MILTIDVDPRRLAINKKMRDTFAAPQDVSKAKQEVEGKVVDWMDGNPEWVAPKYARVDFIFTVPNNKMDVDAPIKRTLDAIEEGIKRYQPDWNDRNVMEVLSIKDVMKDEDPSIFLRVREVRRD
jgi:hypothetical protein